MDEYRSYQISSSEAMRTGCDMELSREERKAYFEQAVHYAAKAFVTADENVFARLLAISQYQCAQAQLLLNATEFDSVVTSKLKEDITHQVRVLDINAELNKQFPDIQALICPEGQT